MKIHGFKKLVKEENMLGEAQKSRCSLNWNIRENLTKICKIKVIGV